VTEAFRRQVLLLQWKLTPKAIIQHQISLVEAELPRLKAECERLGLIQPLAAINPPLTGRNAADFYEEIATTIAALRASGNRLPALSRPQGGNTDVRSAREVLEAWHPVVGRLDEVASVDGCRFDDRYIVSDTTFEALTAVKICAQLYRLRAEADGWSSRVGGVDPLAALAQFTRHARAMPLRIGGLISAATMAIWFRAATEAMSQSSRRASIRASLEKLPPAQTLRATLPGEVAFGLAASERAACDQTVLSTLGFPAWLIRDLQMLRGVHALWSTETLEHANFLSQALPADESIDGPRSELAFRSSYQARMRVRRVAYVPIKLVILPVLQGFGSRGSPLSLYGQVGRVAAISRARRLIVELALEVHESWSRDGRLPDAPKLPTDPVPGLIEYRPQGNRFALFGEGVEYLSDP